VGWRWHQEAEEGPDDQWRDSTANPAPRVRVWVRVRVRVRVRAAAAAGQEAGDKEHSARVAIATAAYLSLPLSAAWERHSRDPPHHHYPHGDDDGYDGHP
jgi:hypothetical protein